MIEYNPDMWEPNFRVPTKRDRVEYRPIIYVSTHKAHESNTAIRDAKRYCEFVTAYGGIPVCPALETLPDSEDETSDFVAFTRNARLTMCAEVWIFNEAYSPSMLSELNAARQSKKVIRHITRELQNYTGYNPNKTI